MKNYSYQLVAIAILFVILLCFAIGIMNVEAIMEYVHGEGVTKNDIEVLGIFGDSAGFLNALFSSLAFGGVVLTIIWQVAENNKQRTDEHRIQFENVFFNMTNTFEHIISELKVKMETDNGHMFDEENIGESGNDSSIDDWDTGGAPMSPRTEIRQIEGRYVTGREVFKYLYEERSVSMTKAIETEGIRGFEKQMSGVLDNYFRYLYRILKYIDSSKLINVEAKYHYAGILRAQLSYVELLLIYYNGLSAYGREKMKPLIERYHLLKNIRAEKLHGQELNAMIRYMDKKDLYDVSAWKTKIERSEVKLYSWSRLAWSGLMAILLALIFNTLIGDFWYEHVIIKWQSMEEKTVRGLLLIAFTVCLVLFRYMKTRYKSLLTLKPDDMEISEFVFSLIYRCSTIPLCLFLLITSFHVNISHQIVWYDSHTFYLDLFIIFLPLLAVEGALIWSIVAFEDGE